MAFHGICGRGRLIEDANERGKEPVAAESGKDMFAALRASLE